ncbi:MAG: tyrosine-type recombinase/integrase [Chthoniobacterales bacterium]
MVKTALESSRAFKKITTVPNLYRRQATGIYYLRVKRRGKEFRRSLRTADFALAKRRLHEFEAKASKLQTVDTDKTLLFQELATIWLESIKPDMKASSHTRRVGAVKALKPFFHGHLVSRIGRRQVEAWKTKRASKVAAQTANIEAETLRLMLDYAMNDLRLLLENPAASIKRRKVRSTERLIPTKEAFRSLVAELRTGHRATGEAGNFVEFLGYSGARQAEASSVQWRDVNLELGMLTITGGEDGTKNHEHRTIPLFPPLRRLLEQMNATDTKTAELFSIRSALLQMHRACKRLGLPAYGHHCLRHFFCSNCIEAGVDFLTLSRWLGHSDGGVLVGKTYGHLRQEHSIAMARRVTFDVTSAEEEPENVVSIAS